MHNFLLFASPNVLSCPALPCPALHACPLARSHHSDHTTPSPSPSPHPHSHPHPLTRPIPSYPILESAVEPPRNWLDEPPAPKKISAHGVASSQSSPAQPSLPPKKKGPTPCAAPVMREKKILIRSPLPDETDGLQKRAAWRRATFASPAQKCVRAKGSAWARPDPDLPCHASSRG